MIEECPEGFHAWQPWAKPMPWLAYDGQPVGTTNVATLSGGTPVTEGWTRSCVRCRKTETT